MYRSYLCQRLVLKFCHFINFISPMHTHRPHSAAASSLSSRSKPKMQTKVKARIPGTQISKQGPKTQTKKQGQRWQAHSVTSSKKQRTRSNSCLVPETASERMGGDPEDEFRRTSRLLCKQSFRHHNPEACLCQICNCNRHLCKLDAAPPNLTMYSTYSKQFNPKKVPIPTKTFMPLQYSKFDGPNIDLASSYYKDYPEKKNNDLSRPKPEDLLKTGGPAMNLTSYSSQFPGHRGPNQYVKPTDKHRRERYPLRGRSTYGSTFRGEPHKDDSFDKMPDNLKFDGDWLGQSTYNNFFKPPKADNYQPHVKHREQPILSVSMNDDKRFRTTHKSDFKPHQSPVCPAKVIIETTRRGQFTQTKSSFKENSDFKGMSPSFRPYSTSRQF